MEIKRVIVHASETYPDMDIGVDWIRNIHVNENGWSDIGYHYVIPRSEPYQIGRRNEGDNYIPGAHVLGINSDSLGICLVGGKARPGQLACNFTRSQWRELEQLWRIISMEWPEAEWSGHNDHDKSKLCPLFDVRAWVNGG